jgi:hypothetical protein
MRNASALGTYAPITDDTPYNCPSAVTANGRDAMSVAGGITAAV